MDGSSVALAALGVVATISGALVWLLKKLFTQNDDTLKALAKSNGILASSIDKLAVSSEKQTNVIEKQEKSAEQWQKYVKLRFDKLEKLSTDILDTQVVKEQTVNHQTVINKE